MNATSPTADRYDVVIVGGALAGSASAILLLREQPALRILVVEKSAAFGRRVGEATVEVSAYFLCRVLGLTQHLNEAHLVKQGMRFWFANDQAATLPDCSEIGGKFLSRIPAFQVDRSTLDEEVLRRAAALGAEICRPANAGRIQLNPGGDQQVEVRIQEEVRQISARWIIDASGCAALLARQQGWLRPNTDHPTTAVWARWTGVKDWDGLDLASKYPNWAMACDGIRGTATNHLVGPGWWAWCIPLKGGDVSVGVVFDQRLVKWPEGGSLGQRLKDFLLQHPAGREIMSHAQCREGDVHWRRNLPYCSTTFAGDGFALVGDASAFLDPFYSPGMDWVSFTTWSSVQLILAQQRGESLQSLLAEHNRRFSLSYERWFRAIYQDKYEYLGEYDLMHLAFKLDIAFYYLGVVSQPFRIGAAAFGRPMFSNTLSLPFYHFIRCYNRRFSRIARSRRERGLWGKRNAGQRLMFPGFVVGPKLGSIILRSVISWAAMELMEGWRTWFASEKTESLSETASAPQAAP